ncbi:hypothetical protein CDAR_425271 [Caerostris darwini]|uniref:Uncharacterized protein n=1 Tax=Caerostris darwini TaxID=1538125 RepID=A0AAV4UMW3_9ARAC|nr:hypothetical protein CDAR_425271 [Caerostris darwini]
MRISKTYCLIKRLTIEQIYCSDWGRVWGDYLRMATLNNYQNIWVVWVPIASVSFARLVGKINILQIIISANIPNELSQRTLIPSDTTGTIHLAEVMGINLNISPSSRFETVNCVGSRRPRISHGEELRASFGEMI